MVAPSTQAPSTNIQNKGMMHCNVPNVCVFIGISIHLSHKSWIQNFCML